jgi:predicted DNA-binding transcriptional regulator AlpA
LETVVRLFAALPMPDRLGAFDLMRRSLDETHKPIVESTAHEKLVLAVRAIHEAERLLDISPDGPLLTIKQYNSVRGQLSHAPSSKGIIDAFGLWSRAGSAARGERISPAWIEPTTIRAATLRARPFADALAALQLWVFTDPPCRRGEDYEAFAKAMNEYEDFPFRLPLVSAICSRLSVGWYDAIAVAEGKATLDEVTRRPGVLGRIEIDEGPLVGITEVARMLDVTRRTVQCRIGSPTFPPPVYWLGGARVWRRDAVAAWSAGRKPRRGELRFRVLESDEVAQRLGITPSSLRV